jgi:glutaredoxin-like protein
MGLLTDSDATQVREILGSMSKDVHITLYTGKPDSFSCTQSESILRELSQFSDKLKVEILSQAKGDSRKDKDCIEFTPAIVISDGTRGRIRFYGTPAGYEFTSLLTTIVDMGSEEVPLEKATREYLSRRLDKDIHIRVFVTPTCPHCPRAAVLSNRLAMGSDRIRSEVIEANEFSDLSARFGVQGVPRTIINDYLFLEGSASESHLVGALERVLAGGEPRESTHLLKYLANE